MSFLFLQVHSGGGCKVSCMFTFSPFEKKIEFLYVFVEAQKLLGT